MRRLTRRSKLQILSVELESYSETLPLHYILEEPLAIMCTRLTVSPLLLQTFTKGAA